MELSDSYLARDLGFKLNKEYALNGEYKSDLEVIKESYNIIIDNFINYANKNDFTTPIDIYNLYNLLLRNGSLSMDNNFIFDDKTVLDVLFFHNIAGANVIKGEGVCSHISYMLNDIFNKQGINSDVISGYLYFPNTKAKEILNKIKNYLKSLYIMGIDITLQLKYPECIFNHNIVKIKEKNKIYFLDSTNNSVMFPTKDNKSELESLYKYKMLLLSKDLENKQYDPTEDLKESIKKIKEYNKDNNEFYKNNKEIYDEVRPKIKRLSNNIKKFA